MSRPRRSRAHWLLPLCALGVAAVIAGAHSHGLAEAVFYGLAMVCSGAVFGVLDDPPVPWHRPQPMSTLTVSSTTGFRRGQLVCIGGTEVMLIVGVGQTQLAVVRPTRWQLARIRWRRRIARWASAPLRRCATLWFLLTEGREDDPEDRWL
jgi:hypothetical protein